MASQFKTFTAGSVLTASEVNSYLMKQAVIVCDSTADYPASPVEGMTVYDKGADALKTYTTATTGFNPPWNMPWGRVGSAVATTNQASITTVVDVTSLTVTWTAVANRYYRISCIIPVFSLASAGGTAQLQITDSTPTTKAKSNLTIATGNDATLSVFVVESGIAAGSTTRKARILTTGGTGTITADTSTVPTIIVEDIGPNGAPA